MSKTYHARKARGVCPACEGVPANGRVHCQDCLDDMQARSDATLGDTDALEARIVQRRARAMRAAHDWLKPYLRTNGTQAVLLPRAD